MSIFGAIPNIQVNRPQPVKLPDGYVEILLTPRLAATFPHSPICGVL